MIGFFRIGSLFALILFCSVSLSFAALEWSVDPAISLDEDAIDSAETADGSKLFVLTKSGKILVLDSSGQVRLTHNGPFKAESLSVSNDGKRIFLAGKGQKNLQVVSLIDRFNIPIGNSPVKGDIAAAVTVAVFSDFQ